MAHFRASKCVGNFVQNGVTDFHQIIACAKVHGQLDASLARGIWIAAHPGPFLCAVESECPPMQAMLCHEFYGEVPGLFAPGYRDLPVQCRPPCVSIHRARQLFIY